MEGEVMAIGTDGMTTTLIEGITGGIVTLTEIETENGVRMTSAIMADINSKEGVSMTTIGIATRRDNNQMTEQSTYIDTDP